MVYEILVQFEKSQGFADTPSFHEYTNKSLYQEVPDSSRYYRWIFIEYLKQKNPLWKRTEIETLNEFFTK